MTQNRNPFVVIKTTAELDKNKDSAFVLFKECNFGSSSFIAQNPEKSVFRSNFVEFST